MLTPLPNTRVPLSADQDVRQAIRHLQQQVAVLSRFTESPKSQFEQQIAGGTVPGVIPGQRFTCFGKILEDGGSGGPSQAKRPSAVTNFAGAGFYLPTGFLAYSFQQVYDDTPWEGVVVEGGIETGFSSDGTQVVDAAVPLNGETFEAGDILFLVRCPPHWAVVSKVGGLRDIDLVCDDETGTATIIKTP